MRGPLAVPLSAVSAESSIYYKTIIGDIGFYIARLYSNDRISIPCVIALFLINGRSERRGTERSAGRTRYIPPGTGGKVLIVRIQKLSSQSISVHDSRE